MNVLQQQSGRIIIVWPIHAWVAKSGTISPKPVFAWEAKSSPMDIVFHLKLPAQMAKYGTQELSHVSVHLANGTMEHTANWFQNVSTIKSTIP